MSIIATINRFVDLFLDTFRESGRWRIWFMLIAYGLIMFSALYAHYDALSPFFYGIMELWTSLISTRDHSRFFHYPGHYLYLSQFFGWARLVIGVLFEGIFLGTAALLFRNYFTASRPVLGQAIRSQLSMWGHFVLASCVVNGLITIAGITIPQMFSGYLIGYERRLIAFQLVVMPCVFAVILALFYSVIPMIAIHRVTFIGGLRLSLRSFAARPFTLFFLASLILVLPVVSGFLADKGDIIVAKFRPELMFWILAFGLIGDMISNFLWIGTATRLTVDERP